MKKRATTVERATSRLGDGPTPEELILMESGARRFTQDRARRTYEALVDAAAATFIEGGYDATGTPDIAARAGVSVGTFYRYFDDKKQIYVEVARRHLAAAYRETLAKLTPQGFVGKGRKDTIAATIDVVFDYSSRHPGMNRVFVEMRLRDPDVAALDRAFEDVSLRRLAALVAAVCPREVVADPEATAWVIHVAAVECASAMAGVRGAVPVTAARAKAALSELVEKALFAPVLR